MECSGSSGWELGRTTGSLPEGHYHAGVRIKSPGLRGFSK